MPPNPDYGLLVLIDHLGEGGAQKILVERFCAPPRPARVVVCTFGDGLYRRDLEMAGVRVMLIRPPRWGVWLLPLHLWEGARIHRLLVAVSRDYDLQVVQAELDYFNYWMALSLKRALPAMRVQWVFHNIRLMPVQARRLLRVKQFIVRAVFRRLIQHVDQVIAVGDAVRQAVVTEFGRPPERVIVIPNGVAEPCPALPRAEVLARLGIDPSARILLNVGRLDAQKGHATLIEAFAALEQAAGPVLLLIAGDGPLRSKLVELAHRHGVEDRVRLLGHRDDVPDLLHAADVFVFPSLWEGLPSALLEAMAAGKPIVASRIAPHEELIEHRSQGLLAAPGSAAALAATIQEVLDDPQLAGRLGGAARLRALAQHSLPAMTEAYLDHTQAIIPRR